MEELKSTEVLDREILEDARKKAHKILQTADDTLASQGRSWERKTKRALESVRKTYAERIKKNENEILARLPLDKRRLRSETAERFLTEAMDAFLRSLDRRGLLSVLERELSERAGELETGDDTRGGNARNVAFSGMNLSELDGLLKNAFAAYDPEAGAWKITEDTHIHEFPSVVVNTNALRIAVSAETAAANLLKDKRAELAAALLGEGVLND
jgi:hypothetical protein